jgi:predicted amidohydrolase YtcJ
VLDRDPFAGPLDEIGAATVVRTVAAGQVVFSS